MVLVLVLLFLIIFNIFVAFNTLAFNIEGNIRPDLEKTIMDYYKTNGVKNLDKFLKIIGIDNYTLTDNKLFLGKEYKINKVSIRGNIIFLDSTIKRISGLREGLDLKDININKIKRNIEKYYRDNGYADGHVKDISYKDGVLFVDVFEGKLYIVDRVLVESQNIEEKKIPFLKFTEDKSLRLPTIAGVDIIPKLYNIETVKYYRNKLNILLNKYGYFDNSVEYYTEKSKINHPFINRKVPFSSILSILPFFHQSVDLIFRINYGPKYELIINGVEEKEKDEILEIIYKNIANIDTFNIREVENKIQKLMLNNLYMKPEVNIKVLDYKIFIDLLYVKRFDKVEYNINYKNHIKNSFVNDFIKRRKLIASDKEFIKMLVDFVTYKLQSEGYYTPDINIDIKDMKNVLLLEGQVDEGSIYKISKVYINEKIFKKGLNVEANEKNLKVLQKTIEDELGQKYMLFSINLIDKKIIENKKRINLFFKADVREVSINDVYIYKKLVYKKMIARFFKKDRQITNEKIANIREALKKQPHINAYNIRPVNNDNTTTDIVVHAEEALKNQAYGSIGYDNIDKIRFTLGYRRKNVLNSLHTLQLRGGITTKEEEFGVSLVGYDVIGHNIDNVMSYAFRDRDEDEYKYMMNRFNLGLNKFGEKYFLGTSVYYENLDIRETVFDKEVEEKFLNNYNNMGVSINFKYFMVDNKLSPKNGAIVDIKVTPVNFLMDNDFFKSETTLTLYKSVLDRMLFIGKGEFGAIAGKNGDIPLTYRFTLGGPNKMKAFDYRDIGSEDKNGNVYGGKYYYYGIAYAGYELAPMTYIGPFVEVGSAFDAFNDIESYNDAGVMLNLKSNVGSFIMSYAVNTKNSEKSKRAFYISFETTF